MKPSDWPNVAQAPSILMPSSATSKARNTVSGSFLFLTLLSLFFLALWDFVSSLFSWSKNSEFDDKNVVARYLYYYLRSFPCLG